TGLHFFLRDLKNHRGDRVYHSLFGTKVLLALAVFFFAAAAVGRARCLAFVRRSRQAYVRIALFLGGAAGLAAVRTASRQTGRPTGLVSRKTKRRRPVGRRRWFRRLAVTRRD
ncbi:MAG: hypothetical protein AAFX50_17865, partial [Acidobacteriota bacterium]